MEHIRVRRTHGSGDGTVQGVKVPSSIDIIWYIVKTNEGEAPIAQALRFPVERWTEAEARKWLKDNGIKYILFEPAAGSKIVFAPGYAVIRVERKALNLTTEEQKTRYWRGFERMRTSWYSLAEKRVSKRFGEELAAVKASLGSARTARDAEEIAIGVVREQRGEWEKLFKALYLAVGEDFAPKVRDSLKASKEMKQDDLWQRYLLDWISANAAEKVSMISDTTRDELADAIAEGAGLGESIDDIAARIGDVYQGYIGKARAVTIARTEVVSASNAASVFVAKSTGLDLMKQWLSTRDDRTRDTHLAADGQERPMDEPFSVGGYELMWPGDGSMGAPASELVRCRCTVTYVVL